MHAVSLIDGLPEMSGFTLNIQAITAGARHAIVNRSHL